MIEPLPEGSFRSSGTAVNTCIVISMHLRMEVTMISPLETMDWLLAQFRERANDDPDTHTGVDAEEVEALFECFHDMVAALRVDLAMITEFKSVLAITGLVDQTQISRALTREQELAALIDRATTGDPPSTAPAFQADAQDVERDNHQDVSATLEKKNR
jgi:hypothetical protein